MSTLSPNDQRALDAAYQQALKSLSEGGITGTAILHQIPRVVIGEHQTFMGREDWLQQEGTEIVLADDPRCIELMQRFISEHPELWNEDIGIPPESSETPGPPV